jgi:hypothetical protein
MGYKDRPTVIVLLGCAGVPSETIRAVIPSWSPPCYIAAYNPTVGLTSLECTLNPDRALRLDSRAAFDLWQSSPTVDPVRPDGKPNRPLTGFDVEFTRLDHPTVPYIRPYHEENHVQQREVLDRLADTRARSPRPRGRNRRV